MSLRRRRWPPILLACVLVIELIAAVALPPRLEHDRSSESAGLLAGADRGQGVSLAVGDRTVYLLGLGPPGIDRLLSRVAANIEAAVGAVVNFWGADWSRDISVVAAQTQEQFQEAAGGGPASQWSDIAAVTVADRVDLVRRVAVGQRIVFAPGAVRMSTAALRIVLSHELFHYAARADTALDAPRWLTEGVADFVARPSLPNIPTPAQSAAIARRLPSDADLDAPGLQRALAYDRAWWFARFVAAAYGPAQLRELYRVACGAGHSEVAIAVHEVLGIDVAGLLVRWQRWLTR